MGFTTLASELGDVFTTSQTDASENQQFACVILLRVPNIQRVSASLAPYIEGAEELLEELSQMAP